MDKAAYKIMISYFLAKKYEDVVAHIDWMHLIDKSVYDILIRISTSDISSKVHGRLKSDRATYVGALHSLLERDLSGKISNEGFMKNLKEWVANNYVGNLSGVDYVSRLAHNLSVRREYSFIESVQYNTTLPNHADKVRELDSDVKFYADKTELGEYINSDGFKKLSFAIDSLRFQARWSQSQRIPQTNVLGHSLYVALLYYFSYRAAGIDNRTFRNNFFAAIFHDYLESYTRDVINPVKTSSQYFNDQIGTMEDEAFNNDVLTSLDQAFAKHFEFLIRNEFFDRRLNKSGTIEVSPFEEKGGDEWQYAEGPPVKVSDSLAALIEAHQSIKFGISSSHLEGAITRVYAYFVHSLKPKISNKEVAGGLSQVFEDFISTS